MPCRSYCRASCRHRPRNMLFANIDAHRSVTSVRNVDEVSLCVMISTDVRYKDSFVSVTTPPPPPFLAHRRRLHPSPSYPSLRTEYVSHDETLVDPAALYGKWRKPWNSYLSLRDS